jgi:hypothetical protein
MVAAEARLQAKASATSNARKPNVRGIGQSANQARAEISE